MKLKFSIYSDIYNALTIADDFKDLSEQLVLSSTLNGVPYLEIPEEERRKPHWMNNLEVEADITLMANGMELDFSKLLEEINLRFFDKVEYTARKMVEDLMGDIIAKTNRLEDLFEQLVEFTEDKTKEYYRNEWNPCNNK